MLEGFDFSTDEVLDEEIAAIWAALDSGELAVSRHAREEAFLDALTPEDLFEVISFFDEVDKDLPDNDLGRAPGISFERTLERISLRVKVGWRGEYYIIVTAMIL